MRGWAVVHGLAFLVIDGQWPEDGPVAPDDEPALARLARRVGALRKGEC
ncbi:MAG: hypothetical protein HY749_24420 [Gammaproteobacteria bacterium]|nr:hypothetical protein [Gammaproteobacteria bacterium]MBI5619117.1 hypothetical protein [Gammaproteobacteria bacterium]